ncbi:hypothetical protein D9M16_08355 [Campylobacter jejuni]|nr:hypothetical protein [Campylobacter jejuni]
MNCRIIDLEQGSHEWLNFRKGKIGASMVASCVGIKGAFNSKEEAKDIILGLKEVYQNEAMKKSEYKELEDTKAKNLTIEIIRLENTIKPIKEKLESLKKELIALANGEKARCLDITIYPQSRTTIDYKGFLEQKNITVPKEFYKESISMCLKIKKGA